MLPEGRKEEKKTKKLDSGISIPEQPWPCLRRWLTQPPPSLPISDDWPPLDLWVSLSPAPCPPWTLASCGQQSPWQYDALGDPCWWPQRPSQCFPCVLSLDSKALFFLPFRPGMHLFGSLTRRNPSQAAPVPSELGTKVGGVTEQARPSPASAALSVSLAWLWWLWARGEHGPPQGLYYPAKQASHLCSCPRSRTPTGPWYHPLSFSSHPLLWPVGAFLLLS